MWLKALLQDSSVTGPVLSPQSSIVVLLVIELHQGRCAVLENITPRGLQTRSGYHHFVSAVLSVRCKECRSGLGWRSPASPWSLPSRVKVSPLSIPRQSDTTTHQYWFPRLLLENTPSLPPRPLPPLHQLQAIEEGLLYGVTAGKVAIETGTPASFAQRAALPQPGESTEAVAGSVTADRRCLSSKTM